MEIKVKNFVPIQKRRDRINRKMLALQELIPHCNKVYICYHLCFISDLSNTINLNHVFGWMVQTDKASMLDEAIEYLKSLQLQVQVVKSKSPT